MREPQICVRCVMDTTDSEIIFDAEGVCNHCRAFDAKTKEWNLPSRVATHELDELCEEIRRTGKGKDFDCIMGLSGGVDSSYVARIAVQQGLRPLCVHLDNGWNSELATANIQRIVSTGRFELFTHVLDWEEFRDLQRSFFKADVIDIELLSDHAIFGVILQLAQKFGLRTILSGANIATEFVMPKSWVHRKQDLKNIRAIHNRFGTRPLKTFPQVSTLEHVVGMYVRGFKVRKPLDLIDYKKDEAKEVLKNVFAWRDYGGKHYESVFTKFYQAYILPTKFGVDKRRAHYSSLILAGQSTRKQALEQLALPLYNESELNADKAYVLKKLGFSEAEFSEYLRRPGRPHSDFASDQKMYDVLSWISRRTKLGREKTSP